VLRKKAEGRQKEGRRKKAADRHGLKKRQKGGTKALRKKAADRHGLKKVKKGKEGTKAKGR